MENLKKGDKVAVKVSREVKESPFTKVVYHHDCVVSVVKENGIYIKGYERLLSRLIPKTDKGYRYQFDLGLYSSSTEIAYIMTTEQALKEQQDRRNRLAEKALLDSAKESLNDLIKNMDSTELFNMINLVESVQNGDHEKVMSQSKLLYTAHWKRTVNAKKQGVSNEN